MVARADRSGTVAGQPVHLPEASMSRILLIPMLMLACLVAAEDKPAAGAAKHQFTPRTGKVTIGDDLAVIDLPEGYRFLPPADARYLLEEVYHNPPNPGILGMVAPIGDAATDDWFIVVTFQGSGFIKDDDAKGLDYGDLLKQMQQATREGNAERKRLGYQSVDLRGWAEAPHYDQASRKIYWAKNLVFGDADQATLNYCVRILGRRGVMELNAVAGLGQLAQVAEGAKAVLGRTEFTVGNRYQDFDSSSDQVAAYGIGGLIAGGVLLKTGLLKLLLKPLIFAGIVLVGVVAKLWKKKSGQAS